MGDRPWMERMQTRIWLIARRAIQPGIVAVVLGVALLAIGARYEQRREDARHAISWLASMS